MRKFVSLILITLFAFAATGQIKKSYDAEVLPINSGWQNYEYPSNRPDAISRSSTFARNGTYSAKVHLESTDQNAQNGNRRAEFTDNNLFANTDSTHRWWAVSYYFPSATNQSDSREHIIAQWHDRSTACSASPTLALEIKNNRFRVARRYSTGNYCTQQSTKSEQWYDIGPVPQNKWLDIVFYYQPWTNSQGNVKIWINDTLKFDVSGPWQYVGSYFPYFKLGIYKWLWNGSVVTPGVMEFYFDRVRIAGKNSTYNDVAVSGEGGGGANQNPTVNAGNPQTITAPSTSTTITGTASDPDGTIASRQWTLVSGPNTPTIVSSTSLSTSVTGLVVGTYVFRLTVTDDDGATASSTTTVEVNMPPTVDLSGNSITVLPAGTTSLNLVGSATDSDGTVSSYLWTRISGPSTVTFGSATSNNTSANGLVPGEYVFRLSATDNDGGIGAADLTVRITGIYIVSFSWLPKHIQ